MSDGIAGPEQFKMMTVLLDPNSADHSNPPEVPEREALWMEILAAYNRGLETLEKIRAALPEQRMERLRRYNSTMPPLVTGMGTGGYRAGCNCRVRTLSDFRSFANPLRTASEPKS